MILLLTCVTARAYDFADTLPTGQVLYYSYVSGGVEVVHPNSNVSAAWSGYVKPTGALEVPATVTHDGNTYAVVAVGDYAFRQCTGLTSVTLADGIATVGGSAFYACSGITTLSLPASVTTVGAAAFSLLSALADVWMWAVTPPATSATAFYSVDLSGCTLHVPCGASTAYSAAPWNAFGSVVEGACVAYVATSVNDPARGYVTGAGSYEPGSTAILTAVPAEQYSFICWNDGDTLNPRQVQVVSDSSFKAMFFPLVVVHDTFVPAGLTLTVLSNNSQLGVGVGSVVVPSGTEVEVCGLPLEGGRFVAWSDGEVDNPRRVTVTGPLTLRAQFAPTMTDAVSLAETTERTATIAGRRLTVCCGVGERLRIFDMQGRCHRSLATTGERTVLELPSAGVWLLQVGDGAARRIVIDR